MIINGFAQSTGWLATWGSWVIGRAEKPWAGHGTVGNLLPTREHSSQNVCLMIAVAGAGGLFGAPQSSCWAYGSFLPLPTRQSKMWVCLPWWKQLGSQANDDAVATEGLFAGWNRQVVVTIFLMGGCYFHLSFYLCPRQLGTSGIEELFGTDAATADTFRPYLIGLDLGRTRCRLGIRPFICWATLQTILLMTANGAYVHLFGDGWCTTYGSLRWVYPLWLC